MSLPSGFDGPDQWSETPNQPASLAGYWPESPSDDIAATLPLRRRSRSFIPIASMIGGSLLTGLVILLSIANGNLTLGMRSPETSHAASPSVSSNPRVDLPIVTQSDTTRPFAVARPPSAPPQSPVTHSPPASPPPPVPHSPAVNNPAPAPAPTPSGAGNGSAGSSPAPTQGTTQVIDATHVFDPGDSVQTNLVRITMQDDGNLVIRNLSNNRVWSSGTTGTGYDAVFQGDGNFVVYTKNNQPVWQTGTSGDNGATLVLQDDGNVTILYGGNAVWASNTQ